MLETCVKNKDVQLVGILKECLMYKNAQNGTLKLNKL